MSKQHLTGELTIVDAKIRAADKQLHQSVTAAGSSLAEPNGIGPFRAARLLGDIGDANRFRTAAVGDASTRTPLPSANHRASRRHARCGNSAVALSTVGTDDVDWS